MAVYRTLRGAGRLIAGAPTGTGKTMAALFPAVKAMGAGITERAVFLTARTTGAAAAADALALLASRGLVLTWVALTARDRLCPMPRVECGAQTCPYARGHYSRINQALAAAYARGAVRGPELLALAAEHGVCPFELSLELAAWADVVVCDYNYVLDPRVALRRLAGASSRRTAHLVDEAHNLPERARDMFSARLSRAALEEMRDREAAEHPRLARRTGAVLDWFEWTAARMDPPGREPATRCVDRPPEELVARLDALAEAAAAEAAAGRPFSRDTALVLRDAAWFAETARDFDERFAACFTLTESGAEAALLCLDPAERLERNLKKRGPAVFFSATMEPPETFTRTLAGGSAAVLRLPSPFPEGNACRLVCARVSTHYTARERTRRQVAEIVLAMARARAGNYLAYLPSYAYLEMIHGTFRELAPEVETLVQQPGMSETARAEFMERFSEPGGRTLVGFATLGGVFGEGVDLAGERLSGAAVVGVGLPGIGPERELIREYHDRRGEPGFDIAYQNPGMNRVLQAAGRVIRSEADRGVLVFIGERFARLPWRAQFPPEWRLQKARDAREVSRRLAAFWSRAGSG